MLDRWNRNYYYSVLVQNLLWDDHAEHQVLNSMTKLTYYYMNIKIKEEIHMNRCPLPVKWLLNRLFLIKIYNKIFSKFSLPGQQSREEDESTQQQKHDYRNK